MTEVEAVTLTHTILGNAGDTYVVFLTLLSGYLIVAHLAGKTLTTGQLVIITALYSLAVGFTLFIWFGYSQAGMYYQRIAAELRGTMSYSGERGVVFGLALNILIALAPLKYMWDVRH